MSTYIIFGTYTQEVMPRIKEAPQELEMMRRIFRSDGVEFKEFYYTFDKYDFVLIAETCTEEAMARVRLISQSSGAVRLEAVVAIPEAQWAKIVKSLPLPLRCLLSNPRAPRSPTCHQEFFMSFREEGHQKGDHKNAT